MQLILINSIKVHSKSIDHNYKVQSPSCKNRKQLKIKYKKRKCGSSFGLIIICIFDTSMGDWTWL